MITKRQLMVSPTQQLSLRTWQKTQLELIYYQGYVPSCIPYREDNSVCTGATAVHAYVKSAHLHGHCGVKHAETGCFSCLLPSTCMGKITQLGC